MWRCVAWEGNSDQLIPPSNKSHIEPVPSRENTVLRSGAWRQPGCNLDPEAATWCVKVEYEEPCGHVAKGWALAPGSPCALV